MKIIDTALWLSMRVGPAQAARLTTRARGGDVKARRRLEGLFTELWGNPSGEYQRLEEAGFADLTAGWRDVETGRAIQRPEIVLRAVKTRGRGRPPGASTLARLTTELAIGRAGPGRPRTGGGLQLGIRETRNTVKNLIHSWRGGRIPALLPKEAQQLRNWLPTRLGPRPLPPDFCVLAGDRTRQPATFLAPHRSLFWHWVTASVPVAYATYCMLAELLDCEPDQVRLAAGAGHEVKKESDEVMAMVEKRGLRVLLNAPAQIDADTWGEAAAMARMFVVRGERILTETRGEGANLPQSVRSQFLDWDTVEREWRKEWQRSVAPDWTLRFNREWRVVWISTSGVSAS